MLRVRQSSARVASVVYVIVLILFGLDLSVAPGGLVYCFILLGLAMFPLLLGSRRYQVFGVLAVVVSLVLVGLEIQAGLRINRNRRNRIEQTQAERQRGTNSSFPTSQQP